VESVPAAILVYSMHDCADCKRSKALLHRFDLAYDEINIDDQPDAASEVVRLNAGRRLLPTIVIAGAQVLAEPSDRDLIAALQASHLI
jgi:mycoredoxin